MGCRLKRVEGLAEDKVAHDVVGKVGRDVGHVEGLAPTFGGVVRGENLA